MKFITKEEFDLLGIKRWGVKNIIAIEMEKMAVGQILEVDFTDYAGNIYSAIGVYGRNNDKKFSCNTSKHLSKWFVTRTK